MAKILISTADLESAGQLRSTFELEDEIHFVSGPFEVKAALEGVNNASAALVLTGSARDELARKMVATVAEHGEHVPVVALFSEEEAVPTGLPAELGIDEHFTKPADPYEVSLVVRRLIRHKHLQAEIGIVGNAESIHEVLERIGQIAPVGSTVLITGESGTGKELVARGLHRLSPRRGQPFIAVNIAALPETLLESELFGHEKGAFTGASSLRKGIFELANGGTVFLDEIAEMPPGPQTRLLRVLEQREFMRVGGASSISVDVRVIAATNRDLRRSVELGEFRRDLYYRLDVLRIHMPPLRERREDIPLLVHAFIREFSLEHRREFKGIAPEAVEIIVEHDWPGNVRELRNLIESMVVLAPGAIIGPQDIPPELRRGRHPVQPSQQTGNHLVPQLAPTSSRLAARLPELELIFRTLVELKYDVDDLRREFEAYRRRHPELVRPREPLSAEAAQTRPRADEGESAGVVAPSALGAVDGTAAKEDEIVFRPGMTMQELERAAIVATLKDVGGNRRRASEKLGIGERTLYRKIKEYQIEA